MVRIYVVRTLSNNYLITDDGDCLIFDYGGAGVVRRLGELGLKPLAIFVTHLHFDHVRGVKSVVGRYSSIDVYVPKYGRSDLVDINSLLGTLMLKGLKLKYVSDGDEVTIGGFRVRAYRVGTHTPHHTCYFLEREGVLVLGDVAVVRSGEVVTRAEVVKELIRGRELKAILPGHGDYVITT